MGGLRRPFDLHRVWTRITCVSIRWTLLFRAIRDEKLPQSCAPKHKIVLSDLSIELTPMLPGA